MKKYINGKYVEMTEEEISRHNEYNEQSALYHRPRFSPFMTKEKVPATTETTTTETVSAETAE